MKLAPLALAFALLPLGSAANPDNIKGNTFGVSQAPIVMEVYSDFECPGCKRFHDETLPMLMKDFVVPGKLYIIYRYFPVTHPHSRQAAEWVCAAAQLGKWEAAGNALFAKQNAWSVDGKLESALMLALTPTEMKKAGSLLKDPAVQSQIDRDVQMGQAIPVPSTPSLMVTHKLRRYPVSGPGVFNYALVKSLLDDLMTK